MKGFQPDPAAKRPPTDLAARRAYDELRRRILTGGLAQGATVNEVATAAELDISRTPMREVLRELLGEGLLTGDGPRRQVRVRVLSPSDVDEVLAARTALESIVVAEAAARASAEDVDELRLLVARISDAAREDDLCRLLDVDEELHIVLARVATSSVTEDVLRRLRAVSRLAWVGVVPPSGGLGHLRTARAQLVGALREGDGPGAVDAARLFVQTVAGWPQAR